MTRHQSYSDPSQGSPNLDAMQHLQDHYDVDSLQASLCVARTVVSGTSGGVGVTIPEGARIVDAWCICTYTNASGAMQVKDGDGNAITDDMTCTTADALTRASTIDTTYAIVNDSGIEVESNAPADAADVYIAYLK